MMYSFYLGKLRLPVNPSKLNIKSKNQNKTISLIDGSQINILNRPGLYEISFDMMIPHQQYPFTQYRKGIYRGPSYFLDELKKMKASMKPFQFVVWRETPDVAHGATKKLDAKGKVITKKKFGATHLFDTNITVSLEDFETKEEANNGFDVVVSVKLKQYSAYGTKKVVFKKPKKDKEKPKATTTKERDKSNKKKPKTHKVVKGDCLWNLAKKYYDDAKKHPLIYKKNKTVIEKAAKEHGRGSSSNGHWIYPGTVLTIPKEE